MNARIFAVSQSKDQQASDRLFDQLDREFTGWDDPATRLMQALEQDELALYAQPILALREGEGFPMAEVLVRLRQEEATLLPPGGFFPLFEHFRLMPELDRWVAHQAITRLAKSSSVLCLSINVSTQTLGDREFLPEIAAEFARTKVSSASLAFEISEQDVLEHPESAKQFAESARAIGCRLMIDGFGRYAVSLAPLKALRLDYVKVDGVIVRSLDTNETSRTKLNAIVRIGQVIGFGVIGECVEKEDALAHLRASGAGYAQGFGIHQPAPIEVVMGV